MASILKKIIPFTLTNQKIKCQGLDPTKEMEALYNKNQLKKN